MSAATAIDLNRFCMKDSHFELDAPWNEGPWTFASDAFVLVRVPHRDDIPARSVSLRRQVVGNNRFDEAFARNGIWRPLPELQVTRSCSVCLGMGMAYECPECGGGWDECFLCKGDGQVIALLADPVDICFGPEICRACEGCGEDIQDAAFRIGGVLFAAVNIVKMRTLPGCEISVADDGEYHPEHFRFEGGDGLIMPIKPEYEKHWKVIG
jgi:hypothetical protein